MLPYACVSTMCASKPRLGLFMQEKQITGNTDLRWTVRPLHGQLLLNIRSTNNSPNCAEAFRRTIFIHEVFGSQCAWEVRMNSTTVQGVMTDGAKL